MDECIILDTNSLELEEIDGHPGSKRQMLLSGGGIAGFVQITYGPPDFTDLLRALLSRGPHRHYHRTVTERHYVLGGDFPVWHWDRPEAAPVLSRIQRHDYLENPPLTLHGITPDATPRAGWKILQWANGFGTELFQPGAAQETAEVAFEGPAPDEAYRRPILVRADRLAWRPYPGREGWLTKVLAAAAPDLPPVSLVHVPAGAHAAEEGEAVRTTAETAWLFVVSGDLALRPPSALGPTVLREGAFCAWSAHSSPTLAGPLSEGGCVLLCVGQTLERG